MLVIRHNIFDQWHNIIQHVLSGTKHGSELFQSVAESALAIYSHTIARTIITVVKRLSTRSTELEQETPAGRFVRFVLTIYLLHSVRVQLEARPPRSVRADLRELGRGPRKLWLLRASIIVATAVPSYPFLRSLNRQNNVHFFWTFLNLRCDKRVLTSSILSIRIYGWWHYLLLSIHGVTCTAGETINSPPKTYMQLINGAFVKKEYYMNLLLPALQILWIL